MTYLPPAIREALDLTNALYVAGLDFATAGFDYGWRDTDAEEDAYLAKSDALDAARDKLRDHLRDMARSEQVAS